MDEHSIAAEIERLSGQWKQGTLTTKQFLTLVNEQLKVIAVEKHTK